jgi:hypothetical protein
MFVSAWGGNRPIPDDATAILNPPPFSSSMHAGCYVKLINIEMVPPYNV